MALPTSSSREPRAWSDIMHVTKQFGGLYVENLHWFNLANIPVLRKKKAQRKSPIFALLA
jgi:hypothetical protein